MRACCFAFSGLLLLFFGANDLLGRERIGMSLGHVDDGYREERQTGNDGIEDRREEPTDPIGLFARFADDTLVAGQQIDASCTIDEVLEEEPLDLDQSIWVWKKRWMVR